MRRLEGRRLDTRDYIEGIPSRFWDAEDDYEDEDEDEDDKLEDQTQPTGR
jgi:hypothetical protein